MSASSETDAPRGPSSDVPTERGTSPVARAPRGTSRSTRAWIAAQVALALVLATAAVVLVTWLSERAGLRARIDLTAGRVSSLSPATLDVLRRLDEPVEVDIFFRPEPAPLDAVVRTVQERTNRVLVLARDSAPGRIVLTQHDLSGRLGGIARVQGRMRELRLSTLDQGGAIVVSQGERRVALRVRGDLSDLDAGSDGRFAPAAPARIVSFRGEEALVGAILKVVAGAEPKVVFVVGHGERDTADTDDGGASELARELETDGFRIETWRGEGDAQLPEDADVVVVLGPEQPLSPAEFDALSTFVEAGGALICAPGLTPISGAHSLAALTERFGIEIAPRGFVARALTQATGGQQIGIPECGLFYVGGSGFSAQPVTDALRRADRRVVLLYARSLAIGAPPTGGVVLPLLRTPEDCWLDMPTTPDADMGDWIPDSSEARGPFLVALEAKFSPLRPAPHARAMPEGVRPESRVLCLGSVAALCNVAFDTNRDLALGLFNHAAAREFRVSVVKKSPQDRRVDVTSGSALSTVYWIAVVLVPGACLLLGLFTAWKRKH